MKNISNIVVLESEDGDWYGLYINGQLQLEGHSIFWADLLEIFDLEYNRHIMSEEALKGLPDKLTDSLYIT